MKTLKDKKMITSIHIQYYNNDDNIQKS